MKKYSKAEKKMAKRYKKSKKHLDASRKRLEKATSGRKRAEALPKTDNIGVFGHAALKGFIKANTKPMKKGRKK